MLLLYVEIGGEKPHWHSLHLYLIIHGNLIHAKYVMERL